MCCLIAAEAHASPYRRQGDTVLFVDLPVMPPIRPMLAKAVHEVPRTPGLCFEPKWDGFRALVFRDDQELLLLSRRGRSLNRYFPELLVDLAKALPKRCVLDGEIVLVTERGLDFDLLQNRLHPAASRVQMLAERTPASFVAFDLLALRSQSLMASPFGVRRTQLVHCQLDHERVHVTPMSVDPDVAQDWFTRFEGAGFDGVMAKPGDGTYQQDKRVLWKVKHERSADCVVAGYRMHKDGEGIGSLLLGLYDETATLHHVGVASSFTARRRAELVEQLRSYETTAPAEHPWAQWADPQDIAATLPGGHSRWSAGKDLSWTPLRIELVAEVRYEHVQNGRLRHGGRLMRFREDRVPSSCTYGQLDEVAPAELDSIFRATR